MNEFTIYDLRLPIVESGSTHRIFINTVASARCSAWCNVPSAVSTALARGSEAVETAEGLFSRFSHRVKATVLMKGPKNQRNLDGPALRELEMPL